MMATQSVPTPVRPVTRAVYRAVASPKSTKTKTVALRLKDVHQRSQRKGKGDIKDDDGVPGLQMLCSLSQVAHKSWTMYRSTPFFNLATDPASLSAYSSQLTQQLRSQSSKHILGVSPIEGNEEMRPAEFAEIKPGQEVGLSTLIRVVVPSHSGDKAEFQAVFCTDTDENVGESGAYQSLPLILTKGPKPLVSAFISFLTRAFDAQIAPLVLNPQEIRLFGAFAASSGHQKLRPFELNYMVPSPERGLAKVSIKVEAATMEALRAGLVKSDEDYDGAAFLDMVEQHFSNIFKIQLRGMRLESVGTGLCFVGSEGKVKILTDQAVSIGGVLARLCVLARGGAM